jgi:hypothetical protein
MQAPGEMQARDATVAPGEMLVQVRDAMQAQYASEALDAIPEARDASRR